MNTSERRDDYIDQLEAEVAQLEVERDSLYKELAEVRDVSEPWCRWHWLSAESRTGHFCLEHMAEAFVPDCPYTSPDEVEGHYPGHYKCQYSPATGNQGENGGT